MRWNFWKCDKATTTIENVIFISWVSQCNLNNENNTIFFFQEKLTIEVYEMGYKEWVFWLKIAQGADVLYWIFTNVAIIYSHRVLMENNSCSY